MKGGRLDEMRVGRNPEALGSRRVQMADSGGIVVAARGGFGMALDEVVVSHVIVIQ
jgi:hypothetical protein